MVCTKKPLLVLIVESRGFFCSANNASCLDNAFVRIPPRVLHFSALVFIGFWTHQARYIHTSGTTSDKLVKSLLVVFGV